MTHRPRAIVLTTLILATAGITGCGGDDDKTSNGAPAATNVTTPVTDSKKSPVSQSAIDACKSSLDANSRISKSIKDDLKDICEKAGSGDAKAAREASSTVCRKIVTASIPAGKSRDNALESCKQTQ